MARSVFHVSPQPTQQSMKPIRFNSPLVTLLLMLCAIPALAEDWRTYRLDGVQRYTAETIANPTETALETQRRGREPRPASVRQFLSTSRNLPPGGHSGTGRVGVHDSRRIDRTTVRSGRDPVMRRNFHFNPRGYGLK
jgi:hypothetical protein